MSALKRTTRRPRAATLILTPTDLAMLDDLYALGVATTPLVLLLRRSHVATDGGMANHRRRIAALFHEGYLSRFDDRFGVVLGSRSFIYAVESGLAAGACATRRHYRSIDDATWVAIRAAVDPARERLIELLGARGHEARSVRARLEQTALQCLRYYSGESTLRHKLLAATASAILWAGARARGLAVHTVLPDGALAIALPRPGGLGAAALKPDLFFGIGSVAVFLEAETGTSSRAKVAAKLAQYAALLRQGIGAVLVERTGVAFSAVRILVHCATDAHANLVASVAASESAALQAALRITGPADLSVEQALLPLPANPVDEDVHLLSASDFVANTMLAPGTSVYDYLQARLDAEIFAAVCGRDGAGPVLTCSRFLPEGIA